MALNSTKTKHQTILVTGGAGFIGYHVSKALLDRGDKVVIVDNFNQYYDPKLKKDRIAALKNYKNLTVIKADLSDFKALNKVFTQHRFTKICHLGAQAGVRYSIENPSVYESSNSLGTLNILELSRLHGVKDVVYASSSSVYGGNKKIPFNEADPVDRPISFYAATKKACELYAHVYHHLYGLNCTGLRFFTVYGPYGRPDMALFKFVDAITKGKPIELYNRGKMKRDFTYISDIVSGVLAALDKPYPCEVFNLGNSNPVELTRFVSAIEKALGKNAQKKYLPMQPGDVLVTYADLTKSRKMLGYKPEVKIEEGVKLFVDWYLDYYHVVS